MTSSRILAWRLSGAACLFLATATLAESPKYHVTEDRLVLDNVSRECPIIYDNDWWKDVPDAAYLWAKASLGEADLRGNIVSRDMWNWQGGYTYHLEQGMQDARSLLEAARQSGLRNIPDPIPGSNKALLRPESGKIEDTKFTSTPGSDLIVREARLASPEKPLLIFAGGPCTTVASAYLADPSIVDRTIVFQVDGGAYNGKDSWSWEIVKQRCRFANWARGYFWGDWSRWNPRRFEKLPRNPLGNALRNYANSDLGKANQWGDGAWIFAVFEPRCITKAVDYDGVAITVPREGTNVKAMEDEFFATMTNPIVYGKRAGKGGND